MKICIYSLVFYPSIGGVEKVGMLVAKEALAAGHDVEVITPYMTTSADDDKLFPFRITRTKSVVERYKAFQRADIVLFMNISLYSLPIAVLTNKPIILVHHVTYNVHGLRNGFTELLKRHISLYFTNIAVSKFVASRLDGEAIVIPNPYDTTLFKWSAMPRDRDFVFCGRLVHDKGPYILLQAFAKVLEFYPNSTLTIIGDGPERSEINKFVLDAFPGNVELTGALSGITLADNLRRHACMVVPSLCEEAFSLVALEGIASCDSVIAFSSGALPEAVGDCGVIIQPTVDGLTNAMMSVMEARKKKISLPGQPGELQRLNYLNSHAPEKIVKLYLDACARRIYTQEPLVKDV